MHSNPRRRRGTTVAAAAIAFSMAFTAGVVAPQSTPLVPALPVVQAQSATGTSYANAIEVDLIAANQGIASETDLNAHRFNNMISGTARLGDRTNMDGQGQGDTPLPEGTPIYLRYQKADSTWSPYYVTYVHERLGQDGGTPRSETDINYPLDWTGAFAFDLSGTDFDVNQHGVQLSLGPDGVGTHSETDMPMTIVRQNPGGDAGFLNSNMKLGAFEFNGTTNSMSHVGIKAYLAGPTGELKTNLRESATGSVTNPPAGSISGNAWWDAMLQEDYTHGETFAPADTQDDGNDTVAPGVRIFAAAPIDDAAHAAIEGWRRQGSPGQWPEDRIALTHNYVTAHPEQFETVWTTTNIAGEYVIDAGWSPRQLNNTYMWAETAGGEIIPGMNAAYTVPEFRVANGQASQDWAGPAWPNNHMPFGRTATGSWVRVAQQTDRLDRDRQANISFALAQNQLLPGSTTDADNWQGTYTPGSGAAGEVVVVKPPTFDDTRTPTVETGPAPEGTRFTITNHDLPAGATVTLGADGGFQVHTTPQTPAGTYTVTLEVGYPDGSTETHDVAVTIGDATANVAWDPSYASGHGTAGETIHIAAPTFDDVRTTTRETVPAPAGTTFTRVDDSFGADATVAVNADGSITAATQPTTPASTYTVTVDVRYADGTTDRVVVPAVIGTPDDASRWIGEYDDVTGRAGTTIDVPAPLFDDVTTGTLEQVAPPAGTSFTPGATTLPEGATATVDSGTGAITVETAPHSAPGTYTQDVVVCFPDGTTRTVTVTVTITAADGATQWTPEYGTGRGPAGTVISVDAPQFKDESIAPEGVGVRSPAPAGTRFEVASTTMPGGTGAIGINRYTGLIDAATQLITPPGDYTVDVLIRYADSSTDTETVTITVEPADNAAQFDVIFNDGEGAAGETIKIPAPVIRDLTSPGTPEVQVPAGTTFTPGGTTLPEDSTFEIERGTGEVTITTGLATQPGTYTSDVVVHYPDDASETVTLYITIGEPSGSDRWEPIFGSGEGPAGGTITIDAPTFDDVTTPEVENGPAPEGTGFELIGDNLPDGSTVEIDTGTGVITVTTLRDVTPGDYQVTVRTAYPDGTTEDKQVTFTVGDPTPTDADNNDPSYVDATVEQGGQVLINPPLNPDGSNAPDGTEFTVKDGAMLPPGLILNEDGSIAGTLAPGVEPGNYPIEIVVTYPDGSTDETGLSINVFEPMENFQEPIPEIDMGKCVATAVGFGLPLLALIPLGLATQINIPGVTVLVDQIDAWFVATNNQLQIDAGLFDGEAAQYAVRFNATLREWAPYFAEVAAGVAIVAMGLLAGTMIYDACTPDDPLKANSSIQGSSGNTYGADGVDTNNSSSESSGASGSSDTGEVPPTE